MGIYDTFGIDEDKARDGAEITFPKNKDGSIPTFRILRAARTNPAWQKEVEAIGRKFKRDMELDILTDDEAYPVLRAAFCKTCLGPWSNIQDPKGNEIPFSFDNALQIMTDLPELYEHLFADAKKLSTFRAGEVEADAKN